MVGASYARSTYDRRVGVPNEIVFGDREHFALSVERDPEADALRSDEWVVFRVFAGGMAVGAESVERIGVAANRLGHFRKYGIARHWGSFIGCASPLEVLQRVLSWHSDSESGVSIAPMATSGALGRYSLNYCFDDVLDIRMAVGIWDGHDETIIWSDDMSAATLVKVRCKQFDKAVDQYLSWAAAAGPPEEVERYESYRSMVADPQRWDELRGLLRDEPPSDMMSSVIGEILEIVPADDRAAWVAIQPTDWVVRRADEIEILDRCDDIPASESLVRQLLGGTDWLQRRAASGITSRTILGQLAEHGRTKRVRNAATQRIRHLDRTT